MPEPGEEGRPTTEGVNIECKECSERCFFGILVFSGWLGLGTEQGSSRYIRCDWGKAKDNSVAGISPNLWGKRSCGTTSIRLWIRSRHQAPCFKLQALYVKLLVGGAHIVWSGERYTAASRQHSQQEKPNPCRSALVQQAAGLWAGL